MGARSLTARQVAAARRAYRARRATVRQLAERYNVAVATMRHAINGGTWRHITNPPPVPGHPPRNQALTADMVRRARTRAAGGETIADLAREMGVRHDVVAHAVYGLTWKRITDPPPLPRPAPVNPSDVPSSRRHADALATLRAQRAADPDDWEPGEYEAARDKIRTDQADARARLEAARAALTAPTREDFAPAVLAAAQVWDRMDGSRRNRLLRELVHRIVVGRDADGQPVIEVHPQWEPDPWAGLPASPVLGSRRPRPDRTK
ncbi:hypothetical protein [Streptomyces aidingensis]|uniref:Helix-turn-helix domain-containing protein n=1 Tax=Streptomyces aidingensis TaxID=910347 RepID=A0A1I1MZT5_9ACTN|nr:hypothetical protein [Streptomyces aidingensis]SFC90402.1 hypothetical protein SAMN05421773_107142 [Streptomyces aidingensis]